MPIKLPDLAYISARVAYNQETGEFFNLVDRCATSRAGQRTGSLFKNGYVYLSFKKKLYLAHRVAWLIFSGDDPGDSDVDHINGATADNRISNLRLATRSQNLQNSKKPASNTSGAKGVCRQRNKWHARFKVNGRVVSLGYYDSFDEAVSVYADAVKQINGEFARTE